MVLPERRGSGSGLPLGNAKNTHSRPREVARDEDAAETRWVRFADATIFLVQWKLVAPKVTDTYLPASRKLTGRFTLAGRSIIIIVSDHALEIGEHHVPLLDPCRLDVCWS